MSLPLFDGGLRRAFLRGAEIRAEQAEQNLESRKKDAIREIVAAETVLHATLQSYQAATELVFKGMAQPSGYTEPLLHAWRLKVKAGAQA